MCNGAGGAVEEMSECKSSARARVLYYFSPQFPMKGEINPPLKPSERAFKRFSLYIRVNGIHPMIRSRFIHTLT